MNKKIIGSGYLFVAAAFVFWISWYLMPDPGTTDPAHILSIVKSSRSHVWYSVLLQVVSSIMYVAALFLLTAATFSHKKNSDNRIGIFWDWDLGTLLRRILSFAGLLYDGQLRTAPEKCY